MDIVVKTDHFEIVTESSQDNQSKAAYLFARYLETALNPLQMSDKEENV